MNQNLKPNSSSASDDKQKKMDTAWWIQLLAIPVAIACVPVFYEWASHPRIESENQFRLYTELLSKREEADMKVRQAIFDRVFDKYLPPDSKDIETRLVGLELMAANFHESVDISPLFWQLHREILKIAEPEIKAKRIEELTRIAAVVKSKQIEGLEMSGAKIEIGLDLDLKEEEKKDFSADLTFAASRAARSNRTALSRHFQIGWIKSDIEGRRLLMQVSYFEGDKARHLVFWVDMYDFPLMNFSRLSDGERVALVLTRLDPASRSATLILVYYPSSRSGTRDKPFIDEVLNRLNPP